MNNRPRLVLAAAVTTAALTLSVHLPAQAQGKIVCWKDAQGKTVGCGDKVPPEYANAGTRELDKQGMVRKTGESTEEAAKRKIVEAEQAKSKADEKKRMEEQKRQDTALLNTFSNEKEIDLKRDRDIQSLNNTITQQSAALKGATERYVEVKKRHDAAGKSAPKSLIDEFARAEREKTRIETDIADKEKAKKDTTEKYAEYRKRFAELKGGDAAPAAIATTPTPAKK